MTVDTEEVRPDTEGRLRPRSVTVKAPRVDTGKIGHGSPPRRVLLVDSARTVTRLPWCPRTMLLWAVKCEFVVREEAVDLSSDVALETSHRLLLGQAFRSCVDRCIRWFEGHRPCG